MEALGLRVGALRQALAGRIGAAMSEGDLPAGVGAIAAALVTGQRGPVPPELLQAYRDAGLAHVLVIAGMHMSMVAGLIFFALRGLLAAIPAVALRYPIKKWTAAGALLVTAGYLVISGAPVPTQRAFIMSGIVLLAVLFDREAISLRSLAWAAAAVLLTRPEALLGPSFQMSFAAVTALVAAYEEAGPRLMLLRRRGGGWWREGLLYVGGILLTTLVAGTATAPYTAFHFERFATYGLLGNALAVPVVGFWIMPAALVAMLLLPFGLDGWAWRLMGHGIAAVDWVARWVSGLPGATVDLPAMPVAALAVFTVGGLWLALWRGRWRGFGVAGMAAGLLLYALHRPPDVLVDGEGTMAAVRGASGTLSFVGADRRALRQSWRRLAGEGPPAATMTATMTTAARRPMPGRDGSGVCAAGVCRTSVRGRRLVLLRGPAPSGEACAGADIVLAAPRADFCPGARFTLTASALRRQGATALWLDGGGGVRELGVAVAQGRRPWSAPLAQAMSEEDAAALAFPDQAETAGARKRR